MELFFCVCALKKNPTQLDGKKRQTIQNRNEYFFHNVFIIMHPLIAVKPPDVLFHTMLFTRGGGVDVDVDVVDEEVAVKEEEEECVVIHRTRDRRSERTHHVRQDGGWSRSRRRGVYFPFYDQLLSFFVFLMLKRVWMSAI